VQGEVLYGILGTTGRLNDPEAAVEITRIYNEWLAGFCSTHRDRFAGLAAIPNHPLEAAIAEVERVAARGALPGLDIANSPDIKPLWDPYWNPLWEVINATGLPLHFHTVGGHTPDHIRKLTLVGSDPTRATPDMTPADLRMARKAFASSITSFQMNMANILMSMIFGGVLERWPTLRWCFAHGGGAFPATLGRIQHGFECRPDLVAVDNPVPPRAYLGRFWVDSLVHDADMLRLIVKLFGEDRVMLGSDYPFPLGESEPGALIRSVPELAGPRARLLGENALQWLGRSW